MTKYQYWLEKGGPLQKPVGIGRRRLNPGDHPICYDPSSAVWGPSPDGLRSMQGEGSGGRPGPGMPPRPASGNSPGGDFGGAIPGFVGHGGRPLLGSGSGGPIPIPGDPMGSGRRSVMGESPRGSIPSVVGSGGRPPIGSWPGAMPIQGGPMGSGYRPLLGSGQRGAIPGSIHSGGRPPMGSANARFPPLADGYMGPGSRRPLRIGSGLKGTRPEKSGFKSPPAQEPQADPPRSRHTLYPPADEEYEESIAASERGWGDIGRTVVQGIASRTTGRR